MNTLIKISALLLIGIGALLEGGAALAQKLENPVEISIRGVRDIGQSPDWIRGALAGSGVISGYSVAADRIVISDMAALKIVNRMRAFGNAANPSLSPAFVSLSFRDGAEHFECVTQNARALLPGFSGDAFGIVEFPASAAESKLLAACRVDPVRKADFVAEGREEVAARYFDQYGELKVENSLLMNDTAFVSAIIELGYFASSGDVSGRLKIR